METSHVELAHLPAASSRRDDPRHVPNPQGLTSGLGPSETTNVEPGALQSEAVPPADRGKDAWLFLMAAFFVEALVWGFPFSYGLFQEHYSQLEEFRGQKNIAIIGTCAMGIMYLSAPVLFAAFTKWPQFRRPSTVIGLFTMCIALALSSFAKTIPHLIVTQGVLFAIGGGACYCPVITFADEWFIERKGLSYGVIWAGTGVAGVTLPLMMQHFLGKYGFRTTLRIWTLALFLLTFPLLKFLKPRLPVSSPRHSGGRKFLDLSFLYTRHFMIMQMCNVVEALGFFLPAIYLPTYAQQTLGSSPLQGAFSILALNVASVFGCICMGSFVDRYHVTTCILISTVGTVLGVFLFWGFATSLPLLYVFATVYGLFAGSFSSTWTGIIRDVQKRNDNAHLGMVFGFLAFGRGIGNVLSGPLSEALVKGEPWAAKAAYGTEYGALITFTGVSALLGGGSFFLRRAGFL